MGGLTRFYKLGDDEIIALIDGTLIDNINLVGINLMAIDDDGRVRFEIVLTIGDCINLMAINDDGRLGVKFKFAIGE